jgi:hypothetical protein
MSSKKPESSRIVHSHLAGAKSNFTSLSRQSEKHVIPSASVRR